MAIINFGSINIDHVYQVPHFVQPGETLASNNYIQVLGGKGANQSIALAQAGSEVKHVGKLHQNDVSFKQTLIKSGVDCKYVTCTDTPSGHAIIQVTPSAENAIVLFGGANQEITKKDVIAALDSAESGDWVLTQNETSGLDDILSEAKANQLKVAFNPAPMSESVKSLNFEHVDLLIVNEVEAAELSEKTEFSEIVDYFNQHWSHAEVLITLGKEGVILLSDGVELKVDAFKVQAVDTTAAGDTFIGYFLSAYSDQCDAKTALRRACAASALAVTKEGAAQSIPSSAQVNQFIENNQAIA